MVRKRQRANGEGSVFRLKNGRYRAQLVIPPVDGTVGKAVKRCRNCRTAMEARAALEDMKREAKLASPQKTVRVSQFLSDWLTRYEKKVKRATSAQARSAIVVHISPAIGAVDLQSLTPKFLDDWFNELEPSRTKQVCFDVLRLALNYAFDMEMIHRNPILRVQRPRVEREEIKPFFADESLLLMKQTEGLRWHALIVLGLTVGMRQGEMLGLRWSDVDIKSKTLSVRQQVVEVSGKVYIETPKTEKGNRAIMIPQKAADALWEHKAIMLAKKLGGCDLVFPNLKGGLARRGNFRTRFWDPLLVRLNLEHRGAHHLRHTFATLALGAGVPVHVVSQILGHTKPSTTLDLYSHAIKPQQSEAMATIQSILGQPTATALLLPPRAKSS